ncbi:RHS repeat domain-containing protein [Primorskyibacter sp. 2E107]|uniref:RHS repeat domain-containing protein n=1 Tax=Primorskyibacter sp. 2E107 TaxID=3403458 RepID=UPI003AF8D6AA
MAIFDASGDRIEGATYRPFGKKRPVIELAAPPVETKGWIGERNDAGAGLQYLNARYYDPELAMFIQPDWFEVTKQGLGTTRCSYSFNDPVNLRDPEGNAYVWALFGNSPYNLVNAIRTHNQLNIQGVTQGFDFQAEPSIAMGRGARYGSMVDERIAAVETFNGAPDAQRIVGPKKIEYFDYKPATRMTKPHLYDGDIRQQNRWKLTAAIRGIEMVPYDTGKLVPETGLRTAVQINGSEGPIYDVNLYPGKFPGVMLYSLDYAGGGRHNVEAIHDLIRRGIAVFLPPPQPTTPDEPEVPETEVD